MVEKKGKLNSDEFKNNIKSKVNVLLNEKWEKVEVIFFLDGIIQDALNSCSSTSSKRTVNHFALEKL